MSFDRQDSSFIGVTAVLPEGCITPEDVGLWSDKHVGPLTAITEFSHSQGQRIGTQIAHVGRKAFATPPWLPRNIVRSEETGGLIG